MSPEAALLNALCQALRDQNPSAPRLQAAYKATRPAKKEARK